MFAPRLGAAALGTAEPWLDVAVLTDGDLVRNLLGEYCARLDAGDFAGVGALFANGRLATEDGRVLAAGAEEVAAFYAAGTQLHGITPATKHLVVDTVLEPAPDGGSISARSSYVVLQAIDGALALQPIIAGHYVDAFTRSGDGWTWSERRFSVGLVGDLTHHLVHPDLR